MPAALKDSQHSLRLPNDLKDKLVALGSHREWRLQQIEDLKAAVLAADQGDFATDDEVSAVLARHTRRKTSRVAAKPTARRRAA